MFRNPADGLRADRAPGTVGEARRRRDRRLRAFLKHERMSVAMNMATVQHHSYMKSAVVDFCVQVGSPLAPVTEYVAPAPAVALSVPSQQLRPATVATGVNLDVTGMVHPQFSSTAVEGSASQVVGSLPLGEVFAAAVFNQVHQEQLAGGEAFSRVAHSPPPEEFAEPVYSPVHQEQFSAGDTTENIANFLVVHEQVIAQDIPEVVDSLPLDEEFTGPVYDQVHQEMVASREMAENFAEIPVVHEQAIVQNFPEVFVPLPPAQEVSAPVYGQVHQVFVGLRPERLVDARRPQRCGRTPPSVGAPVLAVQSLRGFDGVDNTAAKFLLQQALKKKKEEEEERRKREQEEKRLAAHDEATAALERARLLLEGKRRKRKKRRKKRTPRTSSHSSRSRARLRQRQWCTLGWFSTIHAVFPSFLDRPKMPCFLGGMDQKDRYVTWLRPRSSPTSTVALSWLVLRCVSLLCTQASLSAASCAVWTRRTVLLRDSGFSVEPLVSGSHVQCLPRRRQTGIGFFGR